jgi:phosphatidylglycerophosphatase A
MSAPGSPTGAPAAAAAAPGRRPDRHFLTAHPAHLLALGFGSGLPRRAPGTWGTLAGWLLFVALDRWLTDAGWGLVILGGVLVGAWAAQVTGRHLGQADSGHIVIDEIVAFWLVLWLLPRDVANPLLLQAFAFLLFRVFDIVKPPPIRALDTRFKNGVGVMLDDLVAAFYAVLLIALWLRLS